MDNFKEDEQFAKRQSNAKDVKIIFTDESRQSFQVVAAEDEFDKKGIRLYAAGESKYHGFVEGSKPSKYDDCKCPSFTNNNNSKAEGSYIATHGHAFQCKHIIAAREEAVQQKLNIAIANDKSHVEAFSS